MSSYRDRQSSGLRKVSVRSQRPSYLTVSTTKIDYGTNIHALSESPRNSLPYQSMKNQSAVSHREYSGKTNFYRFRSYTNPMTTYVFCCTERCTQKRLDHLLKKLFSSKDPSRIEVIIIDEQNVSVPFSELCSHKIYFVYFREIEDYGSVRNLSPEERSIFDDDVINVISEEQYENIRITTGYKYLCRKSSEYEEYLSSVRDDAHNQKDGLKETYKSYGIDKEKTTNFINNCDSQLCKLEMEAQALYDKLIGVTQMCWENTQQRFKTTTVLDHNIQEILQEHQYNLKSRP